MLRPAVLRWYNGPKPRPQGCGREGDWGVYPHGRTKELLVNKPESRLLHTFDVHVGMGRESNGEGARLKYQADPAHSMRTDGVILRRAGHKSGVLARRFMKLIDHKLTCCLKGVWNPCNRPLDDLTPEAAGTPSFTPQGSSKKKKI